MGKSPLTSKPFLFASAGILLVALISIVLAGPKAGAHSWSEVEIELLRSLWIGSLPPLPPDPSNRYGDDPRAARLGQQLFFDTRFSLNGEVACGTCHLPDKHFQDGIPLAHGIGTTSRRTMTVIGTAYSPWFFWDGRKDSQWAQALGPMENPVEHGGDRTFYAHLVGKYYKEAYEDLFGPLPELSHHPEHAGPVADPQARAAWEAMDEADRREVSRVYANLGKAIAAYERLLLPGPSRFDAYVEAALNRDAAAMRKTFNTDEAAGLRLFIGEANCIQCHNGPLFTDNHFHNTGIPTAAGLPEDTGRASGAQQVLAGEFNCLSPYSDAGQEDCAELTYMISEGHELVRQFKPPSLRSVANRRPFMHAGQFTSLHQVLSHYNTAPAAPAGHSELEPLDLAADELDQIIAFLHTLDGPVNAAPEWLRPPDPLASR